jgi:2-desacetyl-2-hydroxyethyl bacteriochlorophyllide A dehydrogenase
MSQTPPPEASRIVFAGKQQAVLESFPIPPGNPGEIRVRTIYSLMSTGTENIVFNQLYDQGTHWDNWVTFPFYPGYCAVAQVEDPGDSDLAPGDHVAIRYGHQSAGNVSAAEAVRIPKKVPLDQALWFALAKITYHGAMAAEYQLGDRVLVIGAGPIGQMSVRWARAAGAATIIVVDSVAERLEMARAGGATAAISLPIESAREAILEAGHGKLPQIVMDSTGNASVFSAALGLADRFGRVVLMGDTGSPGDQVLTPDVMMRGVRIYAAHDGHCVGEWDQRAIIEFFFTLIGSGRFPLENLNTHWFRPEDCAKAYAAVNSERGKTMGVVFDWSKS